MRTPDLRNGDASASYRVSESYETGVRESRNGNARVPEGCYQSLGMALRLLRNHVPWHPESDSQMSWESAGIFRSCKGQVLYDCKMAGVSGSQAGHYTTDLTFESICIKLSYSSIANATFPTIKSSGTSPQYLESIEFCVLSPATK